MIFYNCNTCGLLTSEIFNRCPECGVYSNKTKESYEKVKICDELSKKMESTIKWIDIEDKKPIGFGWYLVVLKPINFKEFENEKDLNDWIESYGLDKVWFNNGEFWNSKKGTGIELTERVICWADIPSVPLL